MAMLHGTECDEFDKEYAECLSIHAMSLLASKLHESWQLQPKYHSFAARIGDRTTGRWSLALHVTAGAASGCQAAAMHGLSAQESVQ